MTELFFELLQVAIGHRCCLSQTPTAQQWGELYTLSQKHALVGIAYCGIENLPKEQRPSLDISIQWNDAVRAIEHENKLQNKRCGQLISRLHKDGFNAMIFKGQANLQYYPEQLRDRRSPGDIDVWIWPQAPTTRPNCTVLKYCRRIIPHQHICYIHYDFPVFSDISVEAHIRPSFLCNPFQNRKLNRWFKLVQQTAFWPQNPEISHLGMKIDDESYGNLLLLHIYKHLFEEGIGLRQLLDYYIFLTRSNNLPDNNCQSRQNKHPLNLERIGMTRFHSDLLQILQVVFNGASPSDMTKTSRELLDEILRAGNFGKYDDRINHTENALLHAWEKLKHNARILRFYPSEVLWEPFFRLYHWMWRTLQLWRLE
ncbi:MAG: hypothetical protein E7070_00785 [Bacteroidales bacterium]|jgi:hypothetical protein|nr:hypothetical protein [Bacteroidales bacterium]